MPTNIRKEASSGIIWNSVGKVTHFSSQFFVSVILSRILLPKDFGLISMLTIFMALSVVFIRSGMTYSLIQKKNANKTDFSTVFYYNICIGILFYILLYFLAPHIAYFYNQPELVGLTRVISLVFVINAFGDVQQTILRKNLNFKKLNLIGIIGVLVSGTIAIVLVYNGYGIYSIVGQNLCFAATTTIIYWITSTWKPQLIFSWTSLKNLFGFGSKLLLTSLMNEFYKNFNLLVIGKVFSSTQLGYFTRANALKEMPINNTTGLLTNMILPIFSKIESDELLKRTHLKFLKLINFVIFPLMVILILIAKPLIIILFTSKWLPSVPILQILCITGPVYPLGVILEAVILSKGKSGLFLKIETTKKIVGISLMIVGFMLGFYPFIICLGISLLFNLVLNLIYTGQNCNTSILEYSKVFKAPLIISIFAGLSAYLFSLLLPDIHFIQLALLPIIMLISYCGISHIAKIDAYLYLLDLIFDRLGIKKKVNAHLDL